MPTQRERRPRRRYDLMRKHQPQPETAWIYGLADPDTKDIRYVGKTICELSHRLHLHASGARRGDKTRKAAWIRTLLQDGKRPIMVPLECTDHPHWPEAEERWVNAMRAIGCDLLNMASAGGGL